MSFKCSRDREKIVDDRKGGQEDKQGQRSLGFNLIEMESPWRVLVCIYDLRSIFNNLLCLLCRERTLQIQERKCSSSFPQQWSTQKVMLVETRWKRWKCSPVV